METLPGATTPSRRTSHQMFSANCPSRLLFEQVADKWSMMVLTVLGDGPHRFNAIRRRIHGLTQKALTSCLRRLERNGLVARTVIPSSPVGVEYALTPLGDSLLQPFTALYRWMIQHQDQVDQARLAYDADNTESAGDDQA